MNKKKHEEIGITKKTKKLKLEKDKGNNSVFKNPEYFPFKNFNFF